MDMEDIVRPRAAYVRTGADVRRQDLIAATAKCLAERGAAGTSVRMISARAGVSSGLLTHYFDGIDALIVATYRETGRKVSDATQLAVANAGSDPRAQLYAYVDATFRPPVLDPELLATWVAFWSMVKSKPEIAQVHAELYEEYRRDMERLIALCAPHLSERDVRLAAVGITALVDGLWLELCLDPRTFTAAEASDLAHRWVKNLLSE
jgi:TetR/AcrR family transcriptional repressor of bet genes